MTSRRWTVSPATRSVWAIPLVLAVLTSTGLLAALLGTGAWRLSAWVALGTPLVVIARYALVHD